MKIKQNMALSKAETIINKSDIGDKLFKSIFTTVLLNIEKSLGKGSGWIIEKIQAWIFLPETLKYWVGVQRGQSYLMGRRCLFSLGWQPC